MNLIIFVINFHIFVLFIYLFIEGANFCMKFLEYFWGQDWVGLPAGVKFDPTDQELIEHLEAKVEGKSSKSSHPLIDEFIPTIEGEDGICYTHPEKLPGNFLISFLHEIVKKYSVLSYD